MVETSVPPLPPWLLVSLSSQYPHLTKNVSWGNTSEHSQLNCKLDTPITKSDVDDLRSLGYLLAAFGVAMCLPLLVFKLCVSEYRAFPSRMTTLFVAACAGFHLNVLVGNAFVSDWDRQYYEVIILKQEPTFFCKVQGVSFQFFACNMIWLWCSVAFVMYLVVVKGHSFEDIRALEWKFHCFWIGMSSVQTLVPSLIAKYPAQPQLGAPYCWITDQDDQLIQIFCFTAWMFLSLIIGLVFCVKVVLKLSHLSGSETGTDKHSQEFIQVIRGYVWRHAMFAAGFSIVFFAIAFFVANQMLANANIWCVSYPMAKLHVISVSGSGIISFLVLGPTRSNRKILFDNCCGAQKSGPSVEENDQQDEYQQVEYQHDGYSNAEYSALIDDEYDVYG